MKQERFGKLLTSFLVGSYSDLWVAQKEWVNDTVNNCLEINDILCQQSAAMQGSVYRTGQSLQFEQQDNYMCITESSGDDFDKIEVTAERERCVLKQRSPAWFEVRKSAKVTGSTAHKALGLHTLKEQQKHIGS